MLEEILPASVAVAETRLELLETPLFPTEEVVVSNAVEKRQREFVSARACARMALAELGLPPQPVPSGPNGEPKWPDGVVGSITHCEGYRACAVAHATDVAAVGIDAEPNEPLPAGLLTDIALAAEAGPLREFAAAEPSVKWDRLLFSIKETIYKAWFPLAGRWLGFEDALVEIDREGRSFEARLRVPGPRLGGSELTGFDGRWLADDDVVMAAIAVPRRA